MLPPVTISALIQTGVVIILCVGFTFTYMVEKFPNFAHIALATFGTVISYSLVRIYGFNPYSTIPFSMLFCGFLSVFLYVAVVRPIKATGAREITLTFAFFALAQVMASIISVYSYWFMLSQKYPTSGFSLVSSDFSWGGYPGVFVVIIPLCVVLVVTLWLFLTRVKQGIAFRAVAEDEALASSIGVNIYTVHLLTWLITGAIAGLAGSIIPLWSVTGLNYNDKLLTLVMSGSVIGGMNNVIGALVGGFVASTSQKILGSLAIAIYGLEATEYESLYPTLLIAAILMLEPEGIMGFFGHPHNSINTLKIYLNRLRDYLVKIFHVT